MAEFVNYPNSLETEQSLDVMSHFDAFSGNIMENSNLGFMFYPEDNFLPLLEQFSGLSSIESLKPVMDPNMISLSRERRGKVKKRKAEVVSVATNYVGSSVTASQTTKKKKGLGCVKRGRSTSNEVEKVGEVVHVRARRGQATDSHSLAERVRREKINKKMRCLQDLVPGCSKTIGMAGMLDEIISYVQCLQNQVEFLSTKLTEASSFYDFNLDVEPTTTQQVLPTVGDAYEAQEMERLLMGEGYGSVASFQSTLPF